MGGVAHFLTIAFYLNVNMKLESGFYNQVNLYTPERSEFLSWGDLLRKEKSRFPDEGRTSSPRGGTVCGPSGGTYQTPRS